MHPLHNGSQVPQRPERKKTEGIAGYFAESNDNGAPSYPGQDFFNDLIDEFLNALKSADIKFDPTRLDNLAQAIAKEEGGQFSKYDAAKKYKTGEVCYTITGGEVSFWQWYSNVESLAGKSPLDTANRHDDWRDNSKPFYWIPYTGDQVGMPFYWLHTSAPEWAVMEINTNLPVAVYWRLARRYPHLVKDKSINTGEIRAEFIRVADQGRGVDSGRAILSAQADAFKSHNHATSDASNGSFVPSNSGHYQSVSVGGRTYQRTTGYSGSSETRPRNVARSMAIVI